MPYPICSIVAVIKMRIRILITLRSRIWDRAWFLFSDYSKSTVGENGISPEMGILFQRLSVFNNNSKDDHNKNNR